MRPDLSIIRKRLIPLEAVPPVIDILSRGGLDVWIYTDTRVARHSAPWSPSGSRRVSVLSELLGIPTRHVATTGDMPNDVLMFERSGASIAMANASADVQRAATFVTLSNTEEGFAVERFILGAPAA